MLIGTMEFHELFSIINSITSNSDGVLKWKMVKKSFRCGKLSCSDYDVLWRKYQLVIKGKK